MLLKFEIPILKINERHTNILSSEMKTKLTEEKILTSIKGEKQPKENVFSICVVINNSPSI